MAPLKKINLALQGGGAHGAFTWGVLDSLLADPRIEIEGISGASAGAINAVMLADGLARGGPQEARKRLAEDGYALSERLCVYPEYIDPRWLSQNVLDVIKTRYWSFIPRRGSGRSPTYEIQGTTAPGCRTCRCLITSMSQFCKVRLMNNFACRFQVLMVSPCTLTSQSSK